MKNIVVCIKQVPETENVKINKDTNTLVRDGVQSILNPYDAHALELGLSLKEQFSEYRVIAITMGPPQAKEILSYAISVGVDEVILLSDRAFAGADAWATAYTLAQAINQIDNVELIICGKQAIDGDTGQVGPGIAEFLDLPHLSGLVKATLQDGKLHVSRVTDEGLECLETSLPAMVTVTQELNTPRYPSLKGKIKAKNAEIPIWSAEDIKADMTKIGLAGSPTRVTAIFTPPTKPGEAEIFQGASEVCVCQLMDRVKDLIKR